MATKKCNYCQSEIDKKASVCPNCKKDLRNWFLRHPIWTLVIVLFFVGIVGSVSKSSTGMYTVNSNTQQPKSSTTSSNVTGTQPEPATKAGKVEVKSQTKKSDTYNTVVGEVVNNTEESVSYVDVTVTYYDEKGVVVATGFTYAGNTADTPLAPGATAPFEVTSFPDDTIKVSTYKLDVTWN